MGALKQTVRELSKVLAGLSGIPFSDATEGDGAKRQWDLGPRLLVRINCVLVEERKAAASDVVLSLLLNSNVLETTVRLLVSYQSWQDNVQSPSAGSKLQSQLSSFSLVGLRLLERAIRIAIAIYDGYPHTCNRLISAVQYESTAKPGKVGMQGAVADQAWAILQSVCVSMHTCRGMC